ncbi:unnamed protein product [Linum trigynum]|uniref:FHA domain-containing protein n=1 Tax=Linum trigynum TaxID=586398 RepID=A0AAV2FHP6_9ROSI
MALVPGQIRGFGGGSSAIGVWRDNERGEREDPTENRSVSRLHSSILVHDGTERNNRRRRVRLSERGRGKMENWESKSLGGGAWRPRRGINGGEWGERDLRGRSQGHK